MRPPRGDGHRTRILPSLVVLFVAAALLPFPALAADTPLETGRARLEEMADLLGRPGTPDAVLVVAVEDVRASYTEVLGGGRPPADPDGREEGKFARSVESALLRIVGAPAKDRRAKEDDRHAVRVAALRALRWARPSLAPTLRKVLEEKVFPARDWAPLPSLYDEAFRTVLELDTAGSWEWLLERGVNCDNAPPDRERNLAALAAIRLHPAPSGAMRMAVARRIVSIFQAPDAFWNSWYEDLVGVRHQDRKLTKWWYGQFWLDIRDDVIETIRRCTTDPITGAPPADPDDGTEMFLVRRYLVWWAGHRFPTASPWVDPPADAPPADLPPRPKMSALEEMYGITWERWWRENRRLGGPQPYTTEDGFDRQAHRTRVLPELLEPFLDDPDPRVAAVAAVQFGRTGVEGAGARLRALMAPDRPRVVREGAALGLLVLGDAAQRDFLRERAADPAEAPRIRGAAVLALGAIGDRAHVRATFLEGAKEVPPDLQACAVAALGLAASADDGPLLAAILQDRGRPDPARGQTGTALLRVRHPGALEALRGVLHPSNKGADRHVPVVAAAIAWPGTAAPDDAKGWTFLRAWCDRYDDRFGGGRAALYAGLGRMEGPLVRRFLREEYEDHEKDYRRCAETGFLLLALGLQRHEESTAVLRKALEDLFYERDRAAAALGLALAGDRAAAPDILALLGESERYAVGPCILALGMLGHREAVEPIRALLERRRDPGILENGALSLALLLGPGAVGDLRILWERCREPELFDGLAEAFRLAGAPASVEWLRARAADRSRSSLERAAALSALGRMGQDPEGTVLDRLARDHDPYSGAVTLDGIARHRDLSPIRTADR